MSGEVFIMGRNGGGAAAFAFIIVNYPSGSTVTCTNSSGMKDVSSTKKIFYIKKPSSGTSQTCTVTSKTGSGSSEKTAQQTVSVTEGASKTVTLAYEIVIYNAGSQDSDTTGGLVFKEGQSSDFSFGSNKINISVSASQNGRTTIFQTQNLIDLSNFSKIVHNVSINHQAGYSKFAIYVVDSNGNQAASYEDEYNGSSTVSAQDRTINGLPSGNYRIQIFANVYSGDNNDATMSAVVNKIIVQ